MKSFFVSIMILFLAVGNNYAVESSHYNNFNNSIAVKSVENNQSPVTTTSERHLEKSKINLFKKSRKNFNPENKLVGDDWIIALLLCFFLGIFGIHRFYLGYPLIGLFQLFTAGGFVIWAFIDFFLILLRILEPKGGTYKN